MTDKEIADAFLNGLRDRFKNKIDPTEYALSYSGGKDSHFLYWFIKEYLEDTDITIVGVNTGMEIPEIRNRILQNCDEVLHPIMHRDDIKEQYGIPCFTKQQDEYIYRYQHGSRSENTMKVVNRINPIIKLNKTASNLLLSGQLHPISNKCCTFTKKKPLHNWEKKYKKKGIIGVRGTESILRKNQYKTCLKSNGDFTPLYDWTDEMMELVYNVYDIPIPKVYDCVNRTGCAGCPYGRHIEDELAVLPELQRQSIIKYFKESYEVLKINVESSNSSSNF